MPIYPSRETLTHPDLEELAAFLDGKLPEADRARVEEHLAECRDCHEIFVGAVRFQEDSREDDVVVPFFPRQNPDARRWLPLAAAALLPVAAGVSLYMYMIPPDMAVGKLAAAYRGDSRTVADSLWTGTRYRGEPGQDGDDERDSFQLGVQATNLQVSLKAEDRETASGVILPSIRALLERDSFFAADADLKGYQQLRDEVDARRPTPQLLAQATERDAQVRENVAPAPLYFDLGKWAAAAWTAAATKNADFFDRRDNRRFPSWFLRKEGESIQNPEVVTALQKLQQILKDDPVDYDALQQNLKTILNAYDD